MSGGGFLFVLVFFFFFSHFSWDKMEYNLSTVEWDLGSTFVPALK